jgi:hypothetical protein
MRLDERPGRAVKGARALARRNLTSTLTGARRLTIEWAPRLRARPVLRAVRPHARDQPDTNHWKLMRQEKLLSGLRLITPKPFPSL